MTDLETMILLQISPFPAAFVCNYTMAYFLNLSRKKTFAFFITSASFVIQTVLRFCPDLSNPQAINTSAQVLLMFCCALVFSRIPVLHRILAPIVTIIIISIPEPLVLLIFARLGLAWNSLDDYMAMASNPNALFFVRFPYFIFVTFFCFLAVLLWDKIVKKASNQVLFRFLLFPLSQGILLLIANIFAEIHAQETQAIIYCTVLLIATVFCIAADFVLFRGLQQATEKAAAEERAEWSEYLLEQQQIYYTQCLSEVEDASRIRHDLHNQLQTAYMLLSQNEEEKARSILDSISSRLDAHPAYCKNRVVNAILSVKGNLYTQSGLPYIFDCILPDNLPLSDITLCSLFTNILDNAYHAVSQCDSPKQPIHLSAHIKNDFFLLTCQNPVSYSAAPTSTTRKQKETNNTGGRHGLGLSILQNIADTHQGIMEIEQLDGIFKIQILLQFNNSNSDTA